MAHAHNRGVLHRDLKPSNIMLTPRQDGRFDVSILDFGIAKFTDESDFEASKMTKTGDVIGSPAYMSPEQARGTKLDRRSDIYSLGCVMYEACTGVPPFFAKTALETVLMHFNDAPPAMSEASMGKQIDPNLQQFVCRLLEKNPDDRYQTMEAVEHDLMRIRAGKTLIISAPSSAKVKRKPVKKWVAVFAALAVLLLAGVALILWQFTYPSKIAPKAVTLKIDFDLHKFDEVMANSAARRIKRCIDQKNSVVDMTSLDKTSDVLNEDIDPMKGAGFVREVLINNGDIDDQGLKVLADLPITKLRLRNCQLKSLQPLAHHLQLSDLDLQGNPLDSEGIKNIGTIENLDSLNLTSTPIRDADLKSLLPRTFACTHRVGFRRSGRLLAKKWKRQLGRWILCKSKGAIYSSATEQRFSQDREKTRCLK